MTGTFMRKALFPMLASLALCGAATAAFVVTTAHAQPEPKKPMMVAQAATTDGGGASTAGGGRSMMAGRTMHIPTPEEMAAHFKQMCQDRYAHEAGALAY